MRIHLYSTFVDLTKTFDTVNREGLWKIMQKFGCPERFIQIVRQLYDGMMARFMDNGAASEAFAVANGVRQGCVLVPTPFNLMFSAMLVDAYRDESPWTRFAYRTDGQLLNNRQMNFQSLCPQLPSMNFSSPTTVLSTQPQNGTRKGAWTFLRPTTTTSA
ncbi:hypothetical protein SprV_0200894500 [Sparganum proliferum]